MASSSSSVVSGSWRTNYARIGHAAQQLFPDILQELITIKEPAQRLSHDVNKNNYLTKHLRPDEWSMINNVVTKGYANFDISLIYKLIRNLNLVPGPTKGWDYRTSPSPTEVTTGDDIERIRRFRNEKLHKGNAQVTDTELSQFFSEFKDIAGRLETYMGKQTGEFVDKFVDLETCCMDEKTREMYIERIERLKKSDEDCKKRIQAVEKDVDALKKKITSQTEGLEKTAKQGDKLNSKVEVHGKEIKDLQLNQQGQTEGLEKTAKQVDKLKSKEEVHGKEIKDLQVNQRGQTKGLEKTTKEVDKLKSKAEVHGKEIKDLQVNQQGQKEGLENTTKQLDECKRETNKIGEIQTQHLERFENLEQKTESLKLKEEVHGKEIKDLQVNQQGGRNQTSLEGNHQHPIPYKLGEPIFSSYHQVDMSLVDSNESVGITDMEMMDDGRLLICVPEKRKLLIYNSDGSQEDCIRMEGHPSHITRVTFCLVAVTLWNGGLIEMYDINNKLKFKSFRVPDLLGSKITTINNKLVVCNTNSYQLLIIDYQTEEKVEKDTKCYVHGLHGSGDKIFYFDILNNNKLYWYSYTDDLHDSITLPSLPRVMTTLLDGSLYVMCKDGSVQHVSSDGKQFETTTIKGLTRMKKYVFIYNSNQRKLITGGDQDGVLILFYEN